MTGRQLLCILFIYVAQKCTERKGGGRDLKASLPKLREKLLEALQAVLPIVAIVLVLCFTIAPVSPSILLCFLLGAVLIVVGIMFFTLGAEMSMTPMGERVGAVLTRSRKLPVILGVGFLLGFLITISEPDLQVLANQVPSIPQPDPDLLGGGGRGPVPHRRVPAHAAGRGAAAAAGGVLRPCVRAGCLCAPGAFLGRGL